MSAADKAEAKKPKKKLQEIKITDHVAGRFMLPYNIGQVVSIDADQAAELIEAGCAEKV